eukprot:COSAG03_NODE_328_length_8950_cov_24.961021_9_plen_275_part_00
MRIVLLPLSLLYLRLCRGGRLFVTLEAMWTIPMVTAYSWFSFHAAALLNTSLIAAYLDARVETPTALEYLMYVQAAGVVTGEIVQFQWACKRVRCSRVWGAHFEDFWQVVDATVSILWVVNGTCRWLLFRRHTDVSGSDDGDDGDTVAWLWLTWTISISLIVLGMWIRTMQFMMLSETLGPLVMSLISIFKTDVFNFVWLFVVLLFSFSTAFMIIYGDTYGDTGLFNSVPQTMYFTFAAAFDKANLDDHPGASDLALGEGLFWAYFLFVSVAFG